MEKSQSIKNTTSDFDQIVAKAKQVGYDKVPASTSLLESKVIALFQKSGKILTAKQCAELLGERETKWYSDKLWYLAKKGKIEKTSTRGFYRAAK